MNMSKEKAREFLEILEQVPKQELIGHELSRDGLFCTIGAYLSHKNLNLDFFSYKSCDFVGNFIGISGDDVIEITNKNDCPCRDNHQRWQMMVDFFRELSQ